MSSELLERTVTLTISLSDQKTKNTLERMGKSMEEWRTKLERGRKRARAFVDQERRKRGIGAA